MNAWLPIVEKLVDALVEGAYPAVVRSAYRSDLTADELGQVIAERGVALGRLTSSEIKRAMTDDLVEVIGSHPRSFFVDIDLPTSTGERSDLTLTLILTRAPSGEPVVEIVSLHVL